MDEEYKFQMKYVWKLEAQLKHEREKLEAMRKSIEINKEINGGKG